MPNQGINISLDGKGVEGEGGKGMKIRHAMIFSGREECGFYPKARGSQSSKKQHEAGFKLCF
jgi:hypothetical protein